MYIVFVYRLLLMRVSIELNYQIIASPTMCVSNLINYKRSKMCVNNAIKY